MQKSEIYWDGEFFSCGEFNFNQNVTRSVGEIQATFPEFIIMKNELLISGYLQHLKGIPTENFLELGIMRGGSCALFEALYEPENHMAIDIQRHGTDGTEELEYYVAEKRRKFKAFHTIGQNDIPQILGEWKSMTGQSQAEFDVIIDDASHSYDLSLSSFNGLFPYVRVGGVYVIEDWGWAHWEGPWQDETHSEFNSPALSNLSIHCSVGVTSRGGIISKTIVLPNQTFVFRGPAEISQPLDISFMGPMRGRKFQLI